MHTTLRGSSVVRFGNALALAALFALLAPTAGLLANSQLAGWTPNHGHAGRVSALATHSHPYDDHHAVSDTTSDGRPIESDEASTDVTFFPADDAGVAAALVLTREPAALPAPSGAILGTPVFTSVLSDIGAGRVPTPPPRA